MNKTFNKLSVLILFLVWVNHSFAQTNPNSLNELIYLFKNPSKNHILVCAHRGDWRNAPENSIRAGMNCIEMGVDIMELDVQKTKDGVLIIMHDKTLDRTTTGKGLISNITLDSIRKLNLKHNDGIASIYKVPTLEEFMLAVKGERLLINLDKSWEYIPEIYTILTKTGTVNQGIFKGNYSAETLREKSGSILDNIMYMPIIWPLDYNINEPTKTPPLEYTKGFINQYKPVAFEVILGKEEDPGIKSAITLLQNNKVPIWINTLWDKLCAGHQDDIAIDNPDLHWGWIIDKGANVIQTDNPLQLLEYLRSKNLHP